MKTRLLPRPEGDALMAAPLHVIVRDFPETLAFFRAHGVSLAREGHRLLADLGDSSELLVDVERAVLWRESAPAG